jgi:citrate lyase beta subunit
VDTYFFIPANNQNFLKKAEKISACHIILDLEDSIFNSHLEAAIKNIIELNMSKDYYVRIPFHKDSGIDQLKSLYKLIQNGYYRYVIPKVSSKKEIDLIIDFLKQNLDHDIPPELIVLIENPEAMINLSGMLTSSYISGVGFGSHDYCSSMGMNHSLSNINWARMQILNFCKAFGKNVIDIASMNLSNENEFILECRDGFEKGFDAKFIIHPWQLNLINSIQFYTKADIKHAIMVKKYLDDIGGEKNFIIASIGGKVIEKPHLLRIKHILKSTENESC